MKTKSLFSNFGTELPYNKKTKYQQISHTSEYPQRAPGRDISVRNWNNNATTNQSSSDDFINLQPTIVITPPPEDIDLKPSSESDFFNTNHKKPFSASPIGNFGVSIDSSRLCVPPRRDIRFTNNKVTIKSKKPPSHAMGERFRRLSQFPGLEFANKVT